MKYLNANYRLKSTIGQNSLLFDYSNVSFEIASTISLAFQRICQINKDKINEYWPRIRAFWDWRIEIAKKSNNSSDFDVEMSNLVQLTQMAPSIETLVTLSPLLDGLLPHLGRFEYRNIGWDALEQYLAKEINNYPVLAFNLYKQMYANRISTNPLDHQPEARQIIEAAAQNQRDTG